MADQLTQQEQIRREKLAKYVELGIDPFGQRYDVTDNAEDLKNKYSSLSEEELEQDPKYGNIAGRIMFIR